MSALLPRGIFACILALAAASGASPAAAETGPVATQGSTDAGAPIDDHARPSAWRTEFNAGTKDKTASVSLDLFRLSSMLSGSSGEADVSSQSLEFVATVPWDKQSDAFLANLDGLGDGTSLSLTYSLFGSARTALDDENRSRLENAAIARCLADAGRKLGAKPDEVEKTCSLFGTDGLTLVRTYLTPRDERTYTTGFFKSDLRAIAFTGKVEFQGFDHYDPTTLAKMSDNKTSWSGEASYTQYFRSSPTALRVGAAYERAWKGGDKKFLCPAPTGPDPVECVNGADAPPTVKDGFKLSANLRTRFFAGDELSNFAISPKVTYDVTNDVFGAELPIYLVPDKDGGLVGGVKVGYRSDKDDVVFGIFVGTAFGIVQ